MGNERAPLCLTRVTFSVSPTDDNTNSAAQSRDASQFPLLVTHMTQRTELEGALVGSWSFREVLDKLLLIVVVPVRQTLVKVSILQGQQGHQGRHLDSRS